MRKNYPTVHILRIHKADTIGFTTLSADTYSMLFENIDELLASGATLHKSEEFRLVSSSSSNVSALSKKLKNVLSSKKRRKCHALLLEMLDKEADVDAYDDLSDAIYLALGDDSTTKPWCVCIAVSNEGAFRESVILTRRLAPLCEEKNVGLILLSCGDEIIEPSILHHGALPSMSHLPVLRAYQYETKREEDVRKRLLPEEVAEQFQVLFGHFKVKVDGTAFHVPAIASVRKLARNTVFIRQLRDDISHVLGSKTFSICPFGIASGGISELSLALAEGDASKLCDLTNIKDHASHSLLILCDFLSPVYPVQDVIKKARASGIKTLAIAAVASYHDTPEFDGVEKIVYLETGYKAFLDGDPYCQFCNQGVPVIEGEHFEDYAGKVERFHPFTFWEFIAQSKDFYRVGHWASDRTPNHYQFRIMTAPIFQRYGYCIALRLRNVLVSTGILPGFVRKIVCTEGEESTTLSMGMSEVLGLHSEDVIRIPRKFFASIAGKELGPDLRQYMDSQYGTENLKRQNVLIVDQAAHHFKTLSSLRYVCEYYDCAVLAFLVFIDRTDTAFSLGEYLHDSHYVSLYSWPVTPRRSHECLCTTVERI